MTPEQAARPWSDIFKRGAKREETVPAPSPAPVSPDALVTSKVFPRFLSTLSQQPEPVILDLGPVVGSNISYFGDRLACKIYVEDLQADIETYARRGERDALRTCFATRLTQAPGSIDGILCWDIFDFLDKPTGQVLAGQLTVLLRKGGALHGCFGTTAVDLTHYTRTVIESDDKLRQRTYDATPVRRNVLTTRDIIKMFDGLAVAESMLLKSNTRETLFRKPCQSDS